MLIGTQCPGALAGNGGILDKQWTYLSWISWIATGVFLAK